MSWLLCCLTGCNLNDPDFHPLNNTQLGKQTEDELQKQFKDQTQQARREDKLATIHNDKQADLEARSERAAQVSASMIQSFLLRGLKTACLLAATTSGLTVSLLFFLSTATHMPT